MVRNKICYYSLHQICLNKKNMWSKIPAENQPFNILLVKNELYGDFSVIYDNVIYLQHLNLLFNFVVLLCYTTSEQVVVFFDVQDKKNKS